MRIGEPGSLVGIQQSTTGAFHAPMPFAVAHPLDVAQTPRDDHAVNSLTRSSAWRRENLRTNLWLVPTLETIGGVVLFVGTHLLDRAADRGDLQLPSWIDNGSADAARQILIAIAAAVITVIGLVFSVTIVALTLASSQFGPRTLRNFVRDRGTQITLGTFVATFIYAVLALASITRDPAGDFVPHLSITIALVLVVASLGVLIYFINHLAKSIQLPEVIASIAQDLTAAIEAESVASGELSTRESGPSVAEIIKKMNESGAVITAPRSGYLQFVAYDILVGIAAKAGTTIRLLHRPGHFVVRGLPLAEIWPADAALEITRQFERAHFTGANRTLAQDLSFAIDQLVEIALRALSPAVNDTFTALTCVDWLCDGLCKLSAEWNPALVHRDSHGNARVIAADVRFGRFIERAFDKIRQASVGMPAVMIRQLDALARIIAYTADDQHRTALIDQANMILRASEESVAEINDRRDVLRHHALVEEAARHSRNPVGLR
jgi:uncharacterized membrane protein